MLELTHDQELRVLEEADRIMSDPEALQEALDNHLTESEDWLNLFQPIGILGLNEVCEACVKDVAGFLRNQKGAKAEKMKSAADLLESALVVANIASEAANKSALKALQGRNELPL